MTVGDIGIWHDNAGTQTWTTGWVLFTFGAEDRNDGIYTVSGSGKGFKIGEDGSYLCLSYIHGEGGNNRENLQSRIILDGTEIQGSRGAGYQRDTNNNQIYCRGSCMLIGATSGQIASVQVRRDSDNISNTAVSGISEFMMVKIPPSSEVAYGHYGSTYDTDNFDGTTWKYGLWEDKIVQTDITKISGGTGASAGVQHFAILGMCGEDGGDGTIPTLYGSSPIANSVLNIACDEDDITDTERAHTTEDMMYWAFNDVSGNIDNSVGTIIGEYGKIDSIDDSWTTVNLENTYTYPIIVGTHNLASGSDPPETVRISGADSTSFKVRLDAASADSEVAGTVYYMVMESGNHTLPGGDECEAGTSVDSSALTIGSWPGTMDQLTLNGSYTNISIFTQVYGFPENKFLQGWASDGTQSGTPTTTNCYIGRHNGQDTDDTRQNTDIHYIIVERGTGTTDSTNWDAGITADNIAGVDDDPPYTQSLSGFDSISNLANGNIIRLNPSGTRFLVLYSMDYSLGSGDVRTQRISRAAISSSSGYNAIPQSFGYCYIRDDENEYGDCNAWFIHKTTSDDEKLLIEGQRGNADVDSGGGGFHSGSSAVFVMELPPNAETFISHDSTGGEAVGDTTTYLKWMRDVDQNDSSSFTQTSISSMNVEQDCDVLLLANGLLDRKSIDGTRLTTAARFVINGVEQKRGQHGTYVRGDQGTTDTYNGSLNPAGIFGISSSSLVIVQQFDDGEGGSGDDETQASQCGFSALNLDTLESLISNYTTFKTPIGNYLNFVWNSGQFNSDSGMKSTNKSGTNWEWGLISSTSNYYYPSGDYTSWNWISGNC